MQVVLDHSFIFSFDMSSKGAQLAGIPLVLIFLLFLHVTAVHSWDRDDPLAASQWGQNEIRSERFLFESDNKDCVLVGSSMSANLGFVVSGKYEDQPRIVNLSYAGGSALTGMKLIEKSGIQPRCVLVESNLIYKGADDEHIGEMSNPFWMFLKDIFPILRHENQPLNMALTLIRDLKRQFLPTIREGNFDAENGKTLTIAVEPEQKGASDELVLERLEGLAQISDELLERGTEAMLDSAERLEATGTRVYFFEMPGERRVHDSHYYQFLHSRFEYETGSDPATDSRWVLNRIKIDHAYTSDGIHLTAAGLVEVAPQLYGMIADLD